LAGSIAEKGVIGMIYRRAPSVRMVIPACVAAALVSASACKLLEQRMCAANEQRMCACANGRTGFQVCTASGTAFSQCSRPSDTLAHGDALPARDSVERAPQYRHALVHEISHGETVWDVAHEFHVSVAEIMAANGMTVEESRNIRDGQEIFVPGVADDGSAYLRRTNSEREMEAQSIAAQLGLDSAPSREKLLRGIVDRRWVGATGRAETLAGTLRWPVAMGSFVRGYGAGQGGHHKAVDIMGKMGWNVRASAAGIVGYSGDDDV
jgi:LysM repeat protein